MVTRSELDDLLGNQNADLPVCFYSSSFCCSSSSHLKAHPHVHHTAVVLQVGTGSELAMKGILQERRMRQMVIMLYSEMGSWVIIHSLVSWPNMGHFLEPSCSWGKTSWGCYDRGVQLTVADTPKRRNNIATRVGPIWVQPMLLPIYFPSPYKYISR